MAIATHHITTEHVTEIRTPNVLDAFAGLWLMISPFILAFADEQTALWNTLVTGAVITVLAAGRSMGEGYRYAWPSWINLLAGLWLVAAPFVLGFVSMAAIWNSAVLGVIVLAFSGWALYSTPDDVIT